MSSLPSNPTGQQPNTKRLVRLATAKDLSFVLALTKRNSDALGFIPKQAVEWYVQNHLVNITDENGDAAGFILAKHRQPDAPGISSIHQACVCYDLRRRHAGLQLVNRVKAIGACHGNGVMQLWCRGELDANDFWHAAGFEAVGIRSGGRRRGIPHILWRSPLVRGAVINAPPSNRRRTRAGIPVMRPAEISTLDVLAAARAGGLPALLEDWAKRESIVLPADCSDVPADLTDASADIEDAPELAEESPADPSRESANARTAPTGGYSTPLSRLRLSTPPRKPPRPAAA